MFKVAAPVRAHDGDVFEENPISSDRGNTSGGKSDHEQTAFESEALRGLIEIVAAHWIIDHIRAVPVSQGFYAFHPIRLVISNGVIRAVLQTEIEFVFVTDSRNDARAQCFAELHGRAADAACCCQY